MVCVSLSSNSINFFIPLPNGLTHTVHFLIFISEPSNDEAIDLNGMFFRLNTNNELSLGNNQS